MTRIKRSRLASALWCAVLLVFLGLEGRSFGATQTPCSDMLHADEKTLTVLYGTPHREVHWGPPNFGENPETDSKFEVWVLSLDHPVLVAGWHDDSGKNARKVTHIQITDEDLPVSVELLAGDHVRVEGRLEESAEPAEVTEFTLWTSTIHRMAIEEVPACQKKVAR